MTSGRLVKGHIASAYGSRSTRVFKPQGNRRNEQQTYTIVHHGVTTSESDVFGTTANHKSVKPEVPNE